MHITQITINFTETCTLGDYSNTKPSVELTAILDAGDDVQAVLGELVATAKSVIQDKIDEELERVGKPPKYWTGERYDVIYSHTARFVAVVPAESITQLDGGYYSYVEGVRYSTAQKAALKKRSQIGGSEPVALFDSYAPADTIDALRAYTTEQNRIYEQKQQERRQAEEENRRRQEAEWEARRRRELDEEKEDGDDEDSEEEDDEE